ncbi:MAG: hypothetical protein MK085_10485, partial [Phycisphaerales bacterium]|nr:hypothetical protein [Phycisphaerales bacterium]
MHRLPALLASMLGISIAALPVQAQDQANAWDQWLEIMPYLTGQFDEEGGLTEPVLSNDDQILVEDYLQAPMGPPSPELQDMLNRAAPMFDLLRQSSNADFFDPGIDYSQGFMTLLPHLGPMRSATRMMMAQARASAATGDVDAMIDMLGIASRLGTQAGQDGLIISSLVSSANYTLLDQELGNVMGNGLIGQADAAALLEEMTTLQGNDPMNFGIAVEGERDMMMLFLDDMIEGTPEDRTAFLDELGIAGLDIPENMNVEMLLEERELANSLFDQMIEGFNDPDRERGQALLEDIHHQIDALTATGDSLIAAVMPSMLRVLEIRDRIEGMLAARLRQLDGLASGRIEPGSLRNAAIIWLEAGEHASTLDPDVQAAAIALLGLPKAWQSPMPATGRPADLLEPRP